MKQVFVSTQKELDSLPNVFNEFTQIIIKDTKEIVYVIVARENSSVVAWENSSVVARENSIVVARENSSVVARENSSVEARENSIVEARENSSVVAWENSSVEARGNSSVVAWGNSSVVARGNSSVVAWENSSVVARGNSSVEAWGNVGVHLLSDYATVTLFMFSVCWELAKGKIIKKSKTCTVIKPEYKKGLDDWLEREAVKDGKKIILYKKVSKEFKTQENTKNETLWVVGSTVEHHDWKPEIQECGEGKFHACSRTYFCDEFRSEKGDRYLEIEIDKKDLYVWEDNPSYPHKIAFRKCKVLREVNKMGKELVC